jgi:uncharacterized membrane protein HdeD (DUF308 family)
MKRIIYLLTYLAVAVIGILLLIFNQQTLSEEMPPAPALHAVVFVTGVLFVIPGVVMLLAATRTKLAEDGSVISKPWYRTVIALITLIWGILLLAVTGKFTEILAITIGVSLIISGIGSVTWIYNAVRPYRLPIWWYIMPIVVACVGVLCIAVINDFDQRGHSSMIAAIVGGIALILLAANGIMSLNRTRHIRKEEKAKEKAAALAAEEAAKAAESEAANATDTEPNTEVKSE